MPPDKPLTHFRIIQGGLSKDEPAPTTGATQPEPVIVMGQAKCIITSTTTLRVQFWTTTPAQALSIDIEMPDGAAVAQWLRLHDLPIPFPFPSPPST